MDGSRDFHIEWVKSDREEEIYDFPYMWNQKRNDTNEFTYETEIDSGWENELMVVEVGGRASQGAQDGHAHTAIFKMDS